MQANYKDLASGGIFVTVGLIYGGMAMMTLPIGRALNMGPGYFPIILSGILITLGSVLAFRSFSTPQSTPFGVVPWRGVVMLTAATLSFANFLGQLGLFPAVMLAAFLASLSSPLIRPTRGLLISLTIAVLCTLIFSYGIKLPVQPFGPLFNL